MCVGKEIGASGTLHLQGYVEFKKQLRFNVVKHQLRRAHIEVMRGTPLQASDYCKKENNYFEVGRLCENYNGARLTSKDREKGGYVKADRYQAVISLSKEGRLGQIESEYPSYFFNHYGTIKRIYQDYQKRPADANQVTGIWIYGVSGIGKSRRARTMFPNDPLYDKPCNKWWDSYQGEPIVLIDDFDKSHHVLRHHLNRWADRYAFPAESKGSTSQIRPEKIIITSNWSPEEIWPEHSESSTIRRRFEVIHLLQPFVPIQVPDHVSESIEEVMTQSIDLSDL